MEGQRPREAAGTAERSAPVRYSRGVMQVIAYFVGLVLYCLKSAKALTVEIASIMWL